MEAPSSDGYMFAIVDRGADALLASGRITLEAANTLKAEARLSVPRRRVLRTHRVRESHRTQAHRCAPPFASRRG